MSTHKHSEAGNELRSLSMIRYDQSMNATTQRSKDSHFWHLTPLPAHRQVHTSHTPTSGAQCSSRQNNAQRCSYYSEIYQIAGEHRLLADLQWPTLV